MSSRRLSLRGCERGVAGVEFALMLPLLLLLCFGGFEVTRLLLIILKLEKIVYTVADVVSQSTSVTTTQMNNTLEAAVEIMKPHPFGAQGIVIVDSVSRSGTNPPVVRWRFSGGGTLARSGAVGAAGANAVLPGGLTLNDKDNVIVAEAYYHYVPIFTLGIIGEADFYRSAVYKPRLGALTVPPS